MTALPRRVVVLRHGQTAYNLAGRVQGQLDVPLDTEGLAQAARAGAALAGAAFASVVASDLARAFVTATLVAGEVPVVPDARLRELSLGAWQGLTTAEIKDRWPQEYAEWQAGEDVARGGGETYGEAAARAVPCVSDAVAALPVGGTLLVVTHGGTARALLGALLELPPDSWWALAPLGNAAWSVLVEGTRGWRLERHNVGAGDAVGPVPGAHDLGARPAGEPPEPEPVK